MTDNVFNMKAFRLAYDTTAIRRVRHSLSKRSLALNADPPSPLQRYSDEFAGKTGKEAEDVFKQGWDFDRGAYQVRFRSIVIVLASYSLHYPQDFRRIQQPACVPGFEDFDLAKFDVKGIMKVRSSFEKNFSIIY